MKNKKRILVICPYPVGVAAAQRLKYEQYIDNWRENNFEVDISPFMQLSMWNIVHKKGNSFKKILHTILGILVRVKDSFRVRNYDIVYIHMYVTPIGTSFFERLYRMLSKKIIFDLEDNRFLGATKETSGFAQLIRSTAKTKYLVQASDHVITSSPALNDYCLEINKNKSCTYISSSINTERFVPSNNYLNDKIVTIGWTGTFSSKHYLDLLRPMFIELKKQVDFKLIVIGNFEYSFPEMDVELIQWTAQNEIADLQKIDIGVYPLSIEEEQWVMGKSGLKAIQYMAMGLPAVSTNISTVQQFVQHGQNGFLVTNQEEWISTLVELIKNPALRKSVGENARKTVLQLFSNNVIKDQYLAVLNRIFTNYK